MTGPTRTVRLAVIRRDGGRCVICGALVADPESGEPYAQFSLQHRRARGMGGTHHPIANDPVNLILLDGTGTTGCHGRVESERDWGRLMGYAVPQWRNPAEVPVRHWFHGWAWLTPEDWRPLEQSELWFQAGQWLVDEMRLRQVEPDDVDGVTRLSTAAADLFGVMAGDVKAVA